MHSKIVGRASLVGLLGLTALGLAFDATATAGPAGAASATAKAGAAGKTRFLGAHPLAGKPPATGYCYIDVPHVHDFAPDKPAVFARVNDEYVFTGDPVPFGYEGDKTVFYGHHPVPIASEVNLAAPSPTFCFLKGPHYHDYVQPEAPGFKQKDHVIFYVGPIPTEVARERPQLERAVEAEYQPYVAMRPQVTVSPPPEWQGVVWTPPPPSEVSVAMPSPSVVVAPPQPRVVVAPPVPNVIVAPPLPSVVVTAPAVPSVVIAPPMPGVVVMPPHPPSLFIGVPGPSLYFQEGHGHGHGWGHGPGKGWKGGRGWRGGHH